MGCKKGGKKGGSKKGGKGCGKCSREDALRVLFEDFFPRRTPEFRSQIRENFLSVMTGSPSGEEALERLYALGLVAGVALQCLDSVSRPDAVAVWCPSSLPEA